MARGGRHRRVPQRRWARDGVGGRLMDRDQLVLPMRGRSGPLTSVMQHDLARLPPDVLPHGRKRHVGRQDRIVAQDLPQVILL